MLERQEKAFTNGTKTLLKKEGVSSLKSNGVVKRESDSSQGHKKDLPGKVSANGVKTFVKKDLSTPTKPNGTYTKRELDHSAEKKKEASSSGVKAVVKKSVTVSKVTSVKIDETKKKKKVYTLPGQKHEAPEERDPLRIFYESLHEQKPESEMAEVWMMEHGLLEAADAKKALERKQRRIQYEKNGTPMKSTSSRDFSSKPGSKLVSGNQSVSGNNSSIANGRSKIVAEQKGKRKREYSSDDDEFIAKPVKRKLKS